MNKYWKKKTQEEINSIVFGAIDKNINYAEQSALGIPASYLDDKVFNQDTSFIKDAPFISTLIQNPNHIGCHTVGESESFFEGTQQIEKDLIQICSVDILKGEPQAHDGYVASGGTEANIQAIWVYRNYYINEHNASQDEICIICSGDSHYSMDKGANILVLDIFKVPVDEATREVNGSDISNILQQAADAGKKYFIVVCNMMTTMYGSVDDIDAYTSQLEAFPCEYKLHVDGAFGGFYYPFSDKNSKFTFQNPFISSFTLDAHKMAQAPYGTGIFIIKKGLIQNVYTKKATYVQGEDLTLIGSRSGANAVATWMILSKSGPYGWQEKIFILQKRTEWMCAQLDQLNIDYYRHPKSNIITIRSRCLKTDIAREFGLVPDNHGNPNWFKIVIMEHVTIEKLVQLVDRIKEDA